MRCIKCGNELPENVKFCGVCGNMVSDNTENSGVAIENQNDKVDSSISFDDINSDVNSELSKENNTMDSNVMNNSIEANNFVGPDIKPLNQDNINLQNNVNQNFNTIKDNKQSKKKNKVLPILIIGIVFLVAIAFSVLFLFVGKKNSPKSIFVNGIKNVTSKLFIDNFKDEYFSEMSFNTNLKLESLGYNDLIDLINKMDFAYSIAYNKNAKSMDNLLNIKYDGNDLVSAGIYYRDKKMYLDLGNLYSKTIILPADEYGVKDLIEVNTDTKKDLEKLKKSIDKAVDVAFKDNYFKSSKETIIKNGKNKKVTANTMSLEGQDFKTFIDDIMQELKNDNDFIDVFAKVSGLSNDEIKKEFVLDTDEIDSNAKLEITVYTSGLVKTSYDGFRVKMIENGTEISLDIIKANDKKYDIAVSFSGISINGTLTKELVNDETKYSFNMGMGDYSVGLNLNVKESSKANIKQIDTSKLETLSEFEKNGMNEISKNIEKNEAFKKLQESILNSNSYTDSYNYGYDYNYNYSFDNNLNDIDSYTSLFEM